ncbi:heterokaryon incompatibility protein-domain-containing protein [Ampelomyces quisqualis]|uniref:Heterokaryon incompatibility protein-domain-containing protein n=1 Tax=Ampelomyces quisqualis TaxID=50730 RepID=A0A6A5QKJ3_AMPQU|nr:heterokaryon incompatibility protein-domain-containing protein [Ampelomyces quisqualis]
MLPTLNIGVLQCELTTHDFAGAPEIGYNALSYQCGPGGLPCFWIRIDDGCYQVRHNLYHFLYVAHSKILSHDDFGGSIWIDTVCIDQENLSERGHQVKQMGDIYSRAKTVLMWLGLHHSKNVDASAIGLHQLARETESFGSPVDIQMNGLARGLKNCSGTVVNPHWP